MSFDLHLCSEMTFFIRTRRSFDGRLQLNVFLNLNYFGPRFLSFFSLISTKNQWVFFILPVSTTVTVDKKAWMFFSSRPLSLFSINAFIFVVYFHSEKLF